MLQSLLPDMEKNFQRLPSPRCPSAPTPPPQAEWGSQGPQGLLQTGCRAPASQPLEVLANNGALWAFPQTLKPSPSFPKTEH